ncbi:MAG: porin [Bacteroidales bacterium]
MKKISILLIISIIFCSFNLYAQPEKHHYKGDSKIYMYLDTRLDGRAFYYDNQDTEAGFIGRYFMFNIQGKIDEHFSYKFRERLTVPSVEPLEFSNNIDFAYLQYSPNKNLDFIFGKQMVNIGGFEWDKAPQDVFIYGKLWGNSTPFKNGITARYNTNNQKHSLLAQVINSPFATKAYNNTFGYSILWYGNMNWFHTIYSINAFELSKGDFIYYIALGNKINYQKFTAEIDYMNRFLSGQKNYFDDYSLMLKLCYSISDKWTIFTKGDYDRNDEDMPVDTSMIYDHAVIPGVNSTTLGIGITFFPILNQHKKLRFHAFWATNNVNPKKQEVNIGLTWRITAINRN